MQTHLRCRYRALFFSTLYTLASLIAANAIPGPTAASKPFAQPIAVPTPDPTPIPTLPEQSDFKQLTPTDIVLDNRYPLNDPDENALADRGYGGGNCEGCAPYVVTVVATVCPHCHEQQTWYPQTSYVAPAPVYTKTVYPQYYTTTVYPHYTTQAVAPQYVGYCSTLYADGPGLPTTRQGACGTILILNHGVTSATVRLAWVGFVGAAVVCLVGAIWS